MFDSMSMSSLSSVIVQVRKVSDFNQAVSVVSLVVIIQASVVLKRTVGDTD